MNSKFGCFPLPLSLSTDLLRALILSFIHGRKTLEGFFNLSGAIWSRIWVQVLLKLFRIASESWLRAVSTGEDKKASVTLAAEEGFEMWRVHICGQIP